MLSIGIDRVPISLNPITRISIYCGPARNFPPQFSPYWYDNHFFVWLNTEDFQTNKDAAIADKNKRTEELEFDLDWYKKKEISNLYGYKG